MRRQERAGRSRRAGTAPTLPTRLEGSQLVMLDADRPQLVIPYPVAPLPPPSPASTSAETDADADGHQLPLVAL